LTTDNRAGLDPNQRVDEDTAQREWDFLQKMWEPALMAMKKADIFYQQQNDIWEEYHKANPAAPQRPQYHSGRAVALIDHAVDAHLAFHPRFHRHPRTGSTREESRADAVEKGLAGVFQDAFRWQPNIPTKVNGKQLVLHNYTQIYVGLDHEALQRPQQNEGEELEDFQRREWEWESRHLSYNPIRIEIPAPGEVLCDPLEVVPKIAIRKRKMKAYELHHLSMTKARLGAGAIWDMGNQDPYSVVEIMERWSSRWVSVFKDGKLLYSEPNLWWIVPFAQIWSGAATTPTKADFDPADWVKQSLMFRVMDTLQYRDQSFVAQHQLLMRNAYPHTIYAGDPAEFAAQAQGDVWSVSPEDIDIEKTPQFPSQLLQEKQELDRDIEEATYSLQAAGFRQSGVDTATQQVILSEMTNRAFRAVVTKLEALYSVAGSNALRLLWRMNEEMPEEYADIQVRDATLKVSDLGKPPTFDIDATFENIDPVAAQQEINMALTLYQQGLVDSDYVYRVARIEDVSDVRRGVYRDMLRNDPDMIEQGVINALREEGMIELANRRQAELDRRKLQRIAASGQQGQPQQPALPGGGGAPPTNGAAPGPLAGRIPNLGG